MKSTLFISISACLLGGCSSLITPDQQHTSDRGWLATVFQEKAPENQQQNNHATISTADTSVNFHTQLQAVLLGKQQTKLQLSQTKNHQDNGKNINYYVRGLMQDLVGNLQYVNNTTPVAVTSFVMLNSDYQQTNLLGNQISESLLHEVHKFGIPVIDFKTTDYIRVTEQGDFIFSRDFLELSDSSPVRYVVGGTLVKYNGGYLVNARIIGVESKAVVASAQSFIPGNVADALLGKSADRPPIMTSETIVAAPVVSIIQG
ncbi:MAG: TolB-like protein [Paraglaciecola sp.]|jgi:TolB-like protein